MESASWGDALSSGSDSVFYIFFLAATEGGWWDGLIDWGLVDECSI